MADNSRKARDLGLLDAIDAFPREMLDLEVWRVVRSGRDPLLGGPSQSRWCNGKFEVLYTSFDQDGAIAEIHALLSLQPVFPSRDTWLLHRIRVKSTQTLKITTIAALEELGVDTAQYTSRRYERTQEIADAAYFLGFHGLAAPSARWECLNLVIFTDRILPHDIMIVEVPPAPINWDEWRKYARS